MQDINEAGGVLGTNATTAIADVNDADHADQNASGTQSLLSKNPSVIAGNPSSGVVKKHLQHHRRRQGSANFRGRHATSLSGNSPYFFRTVPPDAVQGTVLASTIVQDGVQRLAIASINDEAAIRMAKTITGKFEVVSFSRSWHGVTEASGGTTYSSARKLGVPGAPGQYAIPTPYEYRPDFVDSDGNLDWRRELDYGFAMIDAQSVGSLAACIVEPILSGGGILVPPPGYLAALKEKYHERGTVLNVFERDGLVDQTRTKGEYLHGKLAELVDKHEIVGDARGRGLLQSIEIVEDKAGKQRSEQLGDLITKRCFELGLHMNIVCLPGMGGVFRIAPPLTVSYDKLDEGMAMLDQAIADVEQAR